MNAKYKIILIVLLILIVPFILPTKIVDSFNNKTKVAVCFFGLCRSTHHTIESIQKNIYNALNDLNIDYDVYLHTYKIDKVYNNKWSGESNLQVDNENYKLLNAKYKLIEDENTVIKQLDLPKYRKHGDPWEVMIGNTNFVTLDNAILSLYSTYQVTQLWKSSNIKYNAVIYLRPDVKYLNPITSEYLSLIQDNNILLPNSGEYPINDKFAIGKANVMELYGNRFLDAYEYSLTNSLHTEIYLNHILNTNMIKIDKIRFDFCRISIDGKNRDSPFLDFCRT